MKEHKTAEDKNFKKNQEDNVKAENNELNKDNYENENEEIKNEELNASVKKEKDEKEAKEDKKKKDIDDFITKLKNETQDDLIKKYINLMIENNKLKDENKKKDQDFGEIIDKYKRTLAEMENLRKRTQTDKQDFLKYANFNIINDFLTILDDFQRAIDSAKVEENLDIKNFVEGIEMIEKQFIDLLFKKYGTKKFGDKGEKFDPLLHQALMMEEGDYKDETILEVFRKGYMLHDRVVRHAQVKVGKPKN
ncbi:MAG: nucleotide exchange factor GrpE [Spirochaetes bacterium]|nr:nucleotide exchange factor GrpE [Spirochaetota bacterium]